MLHARKRHRLSGRGAAYTVVFVLLIALSATYAWNEQAFAQNAEIVSPGATLPGTLPPPLRATVTFVHAAPFATPAAATAVDICDSADQVVDALTGIIYQQSEELVLDPGVYNWKVATTGSNCANVAVTLPTLILPNASKTVVVITGDGSNFPIEALVLTVDAGVGNLYFPIIANQP